MTLLHEKMMIYDKPNKIKKPPYKLLQFFLIIYMVYETYDMV